MIRFLSFSIPLVAGALLGQELGLVATGLDLSWPSVGIAGVLVFGWWRLGF